MIISFSHFSRSQKGNRKSGWDWPWMVRASARWDLQFQHSDCFAGHRKRCISPLARTSR